MTSPSHRRHEAVNLSASPHSLRLRSVEVLPAIDSLRATFEVRERDGGVFLAYTTTLRSGLLIDPQASDNDLAGTTGRPLVDALVADRVARRLTYACPGAVVADFDRRGRERVR